MPRELNEAATRSFLAALERRDKRRDEAARRASEPSGHSWMDGWTSHGYPGGYDAGQNNRLTGDWVPGTIGPNRLHQGNARLLRERCRDLDRNNPLASAAISAFIRNVVGEGIWPKADTEDDARRAAWDAEWANWGGLFPGSNYDCDIAGNDTIVDLQTQILRELIVAGGVLVVFTDQPLDSKRQHPLAIELIPEERICESHDSMGPWTAPETGNPIIRGIEIDPKTGRHAGYWVMPTAINDIGPQALQPIRIDASRARYLRLATLRGQQRGISMLAPIVLSLQRLGRYLDSEMIAAELKAQWAYMVNASEDSPDIVSTLADDANAAVVDVDGNRLERLSPGAVYYGRPGDKIQPIGPNVPQADSVPWIQLLQQSIAQGLDLSTVELTRDYSRVNFSSTRAAANRDRITFRWFQTFLINHALNPIWAWFVNGAVFAGRPDFPTPSGYLADRATYLAVRWRRPGWPSVNPVDDANAHEIMLRNGLTTREAIIAANGGDWELTLAQWQRENELFGTPGGMAPQTPSQAAATDAAQPGDLSAD